MAGIGRKICNMRFYIRSVRKFSSPHETVAKSYGKNAKHSQYETELDINHEKPTAQSSLFIIGDRAHSSVSVLRPDLDIATLHTAEYATSLRARGLNLDLKSILSGWKELEKIKTERDNLQNEWNDTRLKINAMNSQLAEYQELRTKCTTLRERIKKLKTNLWAIEDEIMLPTLQLPNKIHPKTQHEDEVLITHTYLSPPKFDFKIKNHVEIGLKTNEIYFSNISPTAYYFRHKTAEFELKLTRYLQRRLSEEDFELSSNPDFCKPPLAESCGLGYLDIMKTLILGEKSNQFYLTGGASLSNLYGFYMRRELSDSSYLPIRQFTIGRHYEPMSKFDKNNLLSVIQSTRIDFIIFTNENQSDDEFEQMVKRMTNIYESFNLHFRVIQSSARDLSGIESRKNVFQVWLPSLDNFVDIGFVSFYGDFISRRLMSRYRIKNSPNEKKYLNAIHGTLLNVTPFIACVMENNQKQNGDWDKLKFV